MFAVMNSMNHTASATAATAAAAASFCVCIMMDSVILTESIFVLPMIIVAVVLGKLQP